MPSPKTPPPAATAAVAAATPAWTPAQLARFAAGLSIEEAAKRLRIGVAYLKRMERQGAWPLVLAERAGREYGCVCDVFMLRYQKPMPQSSAHSNTHSNTRKEAAERKKRTPDKRTEDQQAGRRQKSNAVLSVSKSISGAGRKLL